jgi:transposase
MTGTFPPQSRLCVHYGLLLERCINRLKQWCGIATRYEKTATIYLAGIHIAGIFLWSAR